MSEPMMSHDAIGFISCPRRSPGTKVVQADRAPTIFAGYHSRR
jgi:hypothetical protein